MNLFKWELTYLGHVISKDGMQADSKKIEAIRIWPEPTNVMEVCKASLGLQIIIEDSSRNMHRWLNPYTN